MKEFFRIGDRVYRDDGSHHGMVKGDTDIVIGVSTSCNSIHLKRFGKWHSGDWLAITDEERSKVNTQDM